MIERLCETDVAVTALRRPHQAHAALVESIQSSIRFHQS